MNQTVPKGVALYAVVAMSPKVKPFQFFLGLSIASETRIQQRTSEMPIGHPHNPNKKQRIRQHKPSGASCQHLRDECVNDQFLRGPVFVMPDPNEMGRKSVNLRGR